MEDDGDLDMEGYSITVEPLENPRGTFIRNTDESIIINIDPEDRLDLVNNFCNFITHISTMHKGIKVGCIDCSKEMIVSGNFGEVGHYFEHSVCPDCDGKLINLDFEEEE